MPTAKNRQKNIPPPPTFNFCSSVVHHTVYPLWDSYLLVLGGGVLVCQGFLFLKGSSRNFFDTRGLAGGRAKFFLI